MIFPFFFFCAACGWTDTNVNVEVFPYIRKEFKLSSGTRHTLVMGGQTVTFELELLDYISFSFLGFASVPFLFSGVYQEAVFSPFAADA